MLLHVEGAQPLGLVDEGPLLRLRQQLPLRAQSLRNLRIVHFRVLLGHLPPLAAGPDHEGVHRPLHSVRVLAVVQLGVHAGAAGPALHVDVVVVGWRGGRPVVGRVGQGGGRFW